MNLDQLYPYGFRSTLFERLLPVDDQYTGQGLSIQELRQSIAHDLEDLLNNRMTRLNQTEEHYPGIKIQFCNLELLILLACRLRILQIVTKFAVQ